MPRTVVLLSIPGLRSRDLGSMPRLLELTRKGLSVPLFPSSPAVSSSVQASLTTGVGPERHGVVGSGFYWREKGEVEVGTAWNQAVQAPQIWETLRQRDASLTSALWFATLAKGAKADVICTADPVLNPDGSDAHYCYSKPPELYGTLRDCLGQFPRGRVQEPQPGINSIAWIVDSFVQTAYVVRPRFSFVSLPYLDFATQKFGPNSSETLNAVAELDMAIGALVDGFTAAGIRNSAWLVASEYCVTPVSSVGYPNRVLREAGWLMPVSQDGHESLDFRATPAFAMVDHQLAHIYIRDAADIRRVADLFRNDPAIAHVMVGEQRTKIGLNHERSGEVVLVAKPDSWFAGDWQFDDTNAPRTSNARPRPGYDPLELFGDRQHARTTLDATLVKGSHGALDSEESREGVLVSSEPADWFAGKDAGISDIDVARLVTSLYGP
ncbi:Type I phosphodiesterase / nucleotide pyrophosphatase [Caulifigura coniformis]|uniref:Type I phosphodiesterase / nucleotide pyrophosphatase n=1 Tax=Caulifigura coniformis TaxID=2527983 RepID=A0A517SIR1_9PLAN|nr:nucleotide pyrophosphatase/phosphodiesterase family protein [Caulifigura coniformis]QDT55976.1 Type I phosphodiesterase / nucleotide pyrophosphatase [Caulifigura coniformis]